MPKKESKWKVEINFLVKAKNEERVLEKIKDELHSFDQNVDDYGICHYVKQGGKVETILLSFGSGSVIVKKED